MEKLVLTSDEMKYLGYVVIESDFETAFEKINNINVCFLDCEMVETTLGTEVVVVGFGKKILGSTNQWDIHKLYVKPKGTVLNYLTNITGIDSNTKLDTDFEKVQKFLSDNVSKSDIIVGHHLYIDLNHLKFYHQKVIDCCMLFHHPDGPPSFYSLKDLAKIHLKKFIQSGSHNPIEDGLTSYNLVKWFCDNGYIRTVWKNIGLKLVPSVDLVIDALQIHNEYVKCVYTRGSRAIGTHNENSDYDLIAVCDSKSQIIDGTLVKYGNIDICVYTTDYFLQLLYDQTIYAIEAVYCPQDLIYREMIDHKKLFEKYRQNHKSSISILNSKLNASIGYESSRKISSSKRHFNNNVHRAKKHVFIAIRFVDYGLQIVKFNKIVDLKRTNHVWEKIKDVETKSYDDFKALWSEIYIGIYREFSSYVLNKDIKSVPTIKKFRLVPKDLRDQILNEINHVGNPTTLYSQKSETNPDLIMVYGSNSDSNSSNRFNGVIFDTVNKKIVAYPFDRFFDKKTIKSDFIDRTCINVTEQIDGIPITLYFYNGMWRISSKYDIDCKRKLNDCTVFNEFWRVFYKKGCNIKDFDKSNTYILNLVSKDHSQIVSYDKDSVYLLGVRNMTTFKEDICFWEIGGLDTLQPFIKTDDNFIKGEVELIKFGNLIFRTNSLSDEYVRNFLRLPNLLTKTFNLDLHILKIIQDGNDRMLCRYCPEYSELVQKIRSDLESFIDKMKKLMVVYESTDKKEFSIAIQECNRKYHKYLYAMYELCINNEPIDLNNMLLMLLNKISVKRLYRDIYSEKDTMRTINKHSVEQLVKKEWSQYQIEQSLKIVESDVVDVDTIRFVGGLDISFDTINDNIGVAYLTVYDIVDKKIVFEDHLKCELLVPYISGFLGFREVDIYRRLIEHVKTKFSKIDVLMIDGFGVLHHRGFGSASHIGLELGIPSIGVAKTLLYVDGLDEKIVKKEFNKKCSNIGDYINLIGNSGRIYGVAYKSADCKNPIYVTVGHNISLESAIKIVSRSCIYRIPEPIRNSDIKSKHYL